MANTTSSRVDAAGSNLLGVLTEGFNGTPVGAREGIRGVSALPTTGFDPSMPTLDPAVATLSDHYFFDFYNRIWIIPPVLEVSNPRVNTNIPFLIWNAFTTENTIDAINATDADGLTLDVSEGDVFEAIELRTVNIQVTNAAPLTIEAHYFFDFEQGGEAFIFKASRAFIIDDAPEVPIKETWSWLTDVIVSDDGTEQRIAVRDYPRRTMSQTIKFDGEQTLQEQMALMFGQFAGPVLMPLYQYQTRLKADINPGDTIIYLNTDRTELRQDGYIFLSGRSGSQLVRIVSIAPDSVTVDTPLAFAFTTRAIAMPAVEVLSANNASLKRATVDNVGTIDLSLQEVKPQIPFRRNTNATVFETYDGYPLMTSRAIGTEFAQSYDTGAQFVDYDTGNIEIRSTWKHSQVQFERSFLCHRVFDPASWDWWKAFGDYTKGSQKPFLIPTHRPDMKIVVGPIQNGGTMEVKGSDYGVTFFPHDPFKRLAITTKAGIHYTTVQSVTNVAGNDVIQFSPALPSGEGWETDQTISFLLKVRIAGDKIDLEHHPLHTFVGMTIRTADE